MGKDMEDRGCEAAIKASEEGSSEREKDEAKLQCEALECRSRSKQGIRFRRNLSRDSNVQSRRRACLMGMARAGWARNVGNSTDGVCEWRVFGEKTKIGSHSETAQAEGRTGGVCDGD